MEEESPYNSKDYELKVHEEEHSEEFIRLEFSITASSSSLGTDDTWLRRLGNGQHWQQVLGNRQLGKLAHDSQLAGNWTMLRKHMQ